MNVKSISELSDRELRQTLIELGVKPGPITGTTRTVYEKQLLELSKTKLPDSKLSDSIWTSEKENLVLDTRNDEEMNVFKSLCFNWIKFLSNKQLRKKLGALGREDVGPLTETTRSVWEQLLVEMLLKSQDYDAMFDNSFEEFRYSQSAHHDDDELDKHFEARSLYSFEESRFDWFSKRVKETVINVDNVDLRDVGKSEYDGVRTALALFNGHCQQRRSISKYPPPDKVDKIGYVRNSFVEEKYLKSKNKLVENGTEYKEVFAYHATALKNIPSIIRNNLDPKYPMVHGRRFGDGCYFSEYPEFSVRYGRYCLLIFKILLVPGQNTRYKSDEKGFCEQIIIKDPCLFKPLFVLYF